MNPTIFPRRLAAGLRGHHVAALFFTFFGIVFVVNGAMIYSAISTHTGLVANEPYRKGLHYNDRIAADDRQRRLGWTVSLEVRIDGRIRLQISDSAGAPVRGLKVGAVLGRPSTSRHDVALTLIEREPGTYAATTQRLTEGSWLFLFDAMSDSSAEPVFRARRRLWLKA